MRLKAVGAVTKPRVAASARAGGDARPIGRRPVYFEAGWIDTPVFDWYVMQAGENKPLWHVTKAAEMEWIDDDHLAITEKNTLAICKADGSEMRQIMPPVR